MPEAAVRAIQVQHERDPAQEIWDTVRDLVEGIRIGGPDLLVIVYERHGKVGKSGILLPDTVRETDKWQGPSGLVVKMGPHAYRTEKTEHWFVDRDGEPCPPQVGDWIAFDPKQGHAFLLGDRMARVIPDQYAYAVLPRPDIVA